MLFYLDMENPIVLENRLEGLISTSPLITNPDLIRFVPTAFSSEPNYSINILFVCQHDIQINHKITGKTIVFFLQHYTNSINIT